mmetsp:Transcript_775/g.1882  ORF Transcript_775/g.1882 Transcript_775/m.1882 type:complete len:503 (-) Transcript_775:245-1753(-)
MDPNCHVEMTSDLPMEACCSNTIDQADENVEMQISAETRPMSPSEKPHEASSCSFEESTEMNSPWSSFRDDDETDGGSITSSESSWETYKFVDLRYTMVSNSFFFVGACIQTYTNIVTLKSARADWLIDDNGPWDDDYELTAGDKAWYVLYSLGPFLYIINACIDIRWNMEYLSWSSLWSWICRCFRSNGPGHNSPRQNQENHYRRMQEGEVMFFNVVSDDSNSLSTTQSSSLSSSDESEACWQVVGAFIFGTGAIFEFYSTLLDDYYEDVDDGWDDDAYLIQNEEKRMWYLSNYRMGFVGMHLYLLSGVIELISQRNSYRRGCRVACCGRHISCSDGTDDGGRSRFSSERLAGYFMFLGTVLFICGTLLDCTMAYISDPNIRHSMDPTRKVSFDVNEVTLATCDLISTMLWNVDAVLYIVADVLLYNLHKKNSRGRKWLCEKLSPYLSSGDQDHGNEVNQIDELSRAYLLPVFEGTNIHNGCDDQALLDGSSISNYSTLNN